jgi:lipopolysaccharide export system protein LptA
MLSTLQNFSRRSVQQVSNLALPFMVALPIVLPFALTPRIAEAAPGTLRLLADTTNADGKTGIVVASGNVLITYPARNIEATAKQAVYFSKEGKIVLSGNVIVLQDGGGNSLKGETITYLVKEGRFTATPQEGRQVEATYTIQDSPTAAPAPAAIPTNPAPVKPVKMPFPTAPKPEGAVLPGPNPEKQEPK